MLRFVVWMVSIGTQVLSGGVVSGQDYPNKPIRMVASGVGSGGDLVARLIARGISDSLGQRVIVDNRGGVIAGLTVAKAPPDGYTLLVQSGTLWIGSLLQKTPYDAVTDFSPITTAASTPNILVVHPSVPVSSIKELIALAKAKPGALNYASGGTGTSNHLAGELFKSMASVNFVRINYKGAGPALNDLIGGQVQLMFATAGSVTPHIKSGKLRALAVTSAEPSALAPGLPTVAASGLPGYETSSTQSVFAPAKTPAAIINRLNQEIVRSLTQADVKETLFHAGLEAVSSTPQQLVVKMKLEIARLGKVIKDAGISAD